MNPSQNKKRSLKDTLKEPAPLYVWPLMIALLAIAAVFIMVYLSYMARQ
jgi:hypothetical protein